MNTETRELYPHEIEIRENAAAILAALRAKEEAEKAANAPKITIITNNAPRDLVSFYELPEKARADFDYIDNDEDRCVTRFFQYRGSFYDANEFQTTRELHAGAGHHDLSTWDGYQSDSYFSGVVLRYPLMFPEWPEKGHDYERVIVGRYFS